MSKIPITVASRDDDSVRPLIDGRVSVEGCDVNYLVLPPEECFHRTWLHHEFEVAEIGFSSHLVVHSRQAMPYRATPVFLSHTFRHSAIYSGPIAASTRPKISGAAGSAFWSTRCPRCRGRAACCMTSPPASMRTSTGARAARSGGREDKFAHNLPEGFPLETIPPGKTLEAMTRYSFEQRLSVRPLAVEELFVASTLEETKV